MPAEPLLHWSEPVTEFIGFVSLFLANGAIGFRYAAVRDRPFRVELEGRSIYQLASRRAGSLGLMGTLVQGGLLILQLPRLAARAHTSVGHLVTSDPQTLLPSGSSGRSSR